MFQELNIGTTFEFSEEESKETLQGNLQAWKKNRENINIFDHQY